MFHAFILASYERSHAKDRITTLAKLQGHVSNKLSIFLVSQSIDVAICIHSGQWKRFLQVESFFVLYITIISLWSLPTVENSVYFSLCIIPVVKYVPGLVSSESDFLLLYTAIHAFHLY